MKYVIPLILFGLGSWLCFDAAATPGQQVLQAGVGGMLQGLGIAVIAIVAHAAAKDHE
jgi:hypothetical protein